MTSRACRALFALVLLLGVGVVTFGHGTAVAASATDKKPITVGITGVDPKIPDFTDVNKTITFKGVYRNDSTTARKSVVLGLKVGKVDFPSTADQPSITSRYWSSGKPVKTIPEIAPGPQVDWSVTMKVSDLLGKDPDPGVWAVDVVFADSTGVIGLERTFVVWKPLGNGGTQLTHVALVWPVVGIPTLTGNKDPQSGLQIVNDVSAAQQFALGGRLYSVLRTGAELGSGVNWLIDPDVLYTAQELENGYFVGKQSQPGSVGSDGAKSWYNDMSLELGKTVNCWQLPYADPDVMTLAHLPDQGLLSAAAALQAPPLTGCHNPQTLVWPAQGQTDAATNKAALLWPGAKMLVTGAEADTGKASKVHLPGGPDAVVADPYLSGAFNALPAGSLSDAGVMQGQRWLAETALLSQENSKRTVVAVPPRDFTPSEELVKAINAVDAMPNVGDRWVNRSALNVPIGDSPVAQRVAAIDPKANPGLPGGVANAASDGQKLYGALLDVIVHKDVDQAVVLRTVATWWRGRAEAVDYSAAIDQQITTEHNAVSLAGQSAPLTLSGKSGTVPITIINHLAVSVKVGLQVSSGNSLRLAVATQPGEQVIDAFQTKTVRVPVRVGANGQSVTLTATLNACTDSNGIDCRAYYPTDPNKKGTVEFTVKVSRIGIIALGLMIGSATVLVAAIGARVYRAKRAHHAAAHDTMAS